MIYLWPGRPTPLARPIEWRAGEELPDEILRSSVMTIQADGEEFGLLVWLLSKLELVGTRPPVEDDDEDDDDETDPDALPRLGKYIVNWNDWTCATCGKQIDLSIGYRSDSDRKVHCLEHDFPNVAERRERK